MAYMDKAKTVEWTTPKTVFDELNKEFNFDLDVASTHENALCEKHYTQAENGLVQSWGGIMCFAIRHTVILASGLEKHTKNAIRQTVLCF